jgi:hypothetical protein
MICFLQGWFLLVDLAVPCLIVSTDKNRYMFGFLGPASDAKKAEA